MTGSGTEVGPLQKTCRLVSFEESACQHGMGSKLLRPVLESDEKACRPAALGR